MFQKIDTDNDGIVSVEELKVGLQKFGSQLAESEVQMLIEAVSILKYSLCITLELSPNLVIITS